MKTRLGFVPCHRYPYDEGWAAEMRQRFQKALKGLEGVELVTPSGALTHDGLVRDDASAQAAIDLFAQRGVQGLLLGAMTRGDEAAACAVAQALNVPVLVFGAREDELPSEGTRRADGLAGALAIAAGLKRRGIGYLFAGAHAPEDPLLRQSVMAFARGCAVLRRVVGARIGLVGMPSARDEAAQANPSALLRRLRVQVVSIELSALLAGAEAIAADDHRAVALARTLAQEADCAALDDAALARLARLELALEALCKERGLAAVAVASDSDAQERYGAAFGSTLGRLTAAGTPAAADADVYGALSMLLLRAATRDEELPFGADLASANPSERNEVLLRNDGSAPVRLAADAAAVVLREQPLLADAIGADKALGAVEFRLKPGVVTVCRLAETDGAFRLLIAVGEVVASAEAGRGVWGWLRVADAQRLYRTMGEGGFAARVSLVYADVSAALGVCCEAAGLEVVRIA